MTEYDQERATTESIAATGRDDSGAATTTADHRPQVRHDGAVADGRTADGLVGDERTSDEGFHDGQAHAAPSGYAPDRAATVPGDGEAAPSMSRPAAEDVRLMPDEHAERLREQWHQVQATFVDDPRGAVSKADTLVAEVMQTLAAGFADHKRGLEESWQRGEEAGTEDLRQALQSYRAFFDRLLHS